MRITLQNKALFAHVKTFKESSGSRTLALRSEMEVYRPKIVRNAEAAEGLVRYHIRGTGDSPMIINQLNSASEVFFQLMNWLPQFRKIHCAFAIPKVNCISNQYRRTAKEEDTKAYPSHKKRRRDSQDRSKHRNRICQHERHNPEQGTHPEPDAPGKKRVVRKSVPGLDHLVHYHVVHVLDACVAEDQTRAEQCREKNAVSGFTGDSWCGAKSGRYHVLARETVDNACYDDIHWHADRVEPDDGWCVILTPEELMSVHEHSVVTTSGLSYGLRISHMTVTKAWLPA